VSIFDVEQVGEERVACKRLNETFPSFVDIVSKVLREKCFQSPFFVWEFLFKIIYRIGIRHKLEQARVRTSNKYLIRIEIYRMILSFKYLL